MMNICSNGMLKPIRSRSGRKSSWNVTDWLSSTLDLSPQTAHRLRTLAYAEHGFVQQSLASGKIGLDRSYFLTRLAKTSLAAICLDSLTGSGGRKKAGRDGR
jgi:hypothetical protein